MGIRGVKKPHPLDPAAAGVSQLLARGASGVKRPHPLGSVPSRSGASQLTAESGVASVTVPGVKISALPAASGGTASDQFEVNQGGTSKRLTAAQLATALPPVDWSSITGKPTSMPPNGPASGDLAGTYPGPTIKPSVTNGQVLTTVGGVSAWAAPAGGAPSGAASGDLAGSYPGPTIKASVGLTGTPTAPTATPSSTSTAQIATTAFVQSALPTTLPGPPTGTAGGGLAGTYPNPTIKPSTTNGDVLTTVAGAAAWAAPTGGGGSATLATGAVGYGSGTNVLTGVLADFAWDATNKRLGLNTTPTSTLHAKSLVDGGSAFKAEATASTGTFAEFFTLSASDANPGSGFVFKINGGFNAGINYMSLDRSGYLSVYGNVHVLYPFSAPAGGGSWCGIPVTNGNTGFFVSNGAPTWTADKGTLSLDNSGSLPWYNPTGTGTWDRLVGETSTQTLTNKTLGTGTVLSGYLPIGGGTLTGALTGTAATFTGNITQSGSSAGGGHVFYADTNTGGQTWQTGPGAGTGSPDEWAIYNQGTSLRLLSLNKTGSVQVFGALTGTTATFTGTVTMPTASWPGGTGGQTFLAADFALNSTGSAFSVLNTGSIGAAGQVFEIEFSLSLFETTGANTIYFGIHDGTSYLHGSPITIPQNIRTQAALSVRATLAAATTFTVRVQPANLTTTIVATTGGTPFVANKASYIKWTRLA